ncbi:MAG: TonB-dependent receptor [Paraglaciecola sp.]|nr:TonB-dependent receptor [Paraglaciecola sp.]
MATNITRSHGPKFRKSLLALAIVGACATVHAQETDTAANPDEASEIEKIQVSGTRANLLNAQNLKRNSDTVVDSITAADIGSLPDRSVLEAIQRLPGVSIELFAGPDDPDHFSVEGSGAIIRGLTQTRSEFNGRDSFSANSGRGLSFQDVSPELMGGVDVFKNQTADMIEGGIGGTISLRTRKPFDSDGQVFAFNADYSHGDLADDWTPTLSALYSNRWKSDVGEFGLLVNYADSKLMGQSHGIQSDAVIQYYARDLAGAEAFVGSDNNGTVWIPQASNLLQKTDDRKRKGAALALQFENSDETFLATFQYLRSDSKLTWNERAVKYQGGYYTIDARRATNFPGTEFEFNDEGVFESGMISLNDQDGGWRVPDSSSNRVPRAWTGNGVPTREWGLNTQMDSRVNQTESLVQDYSLNLKWQASENLDLVGDIQYIKADAQNDDLAVHLNTWALQRYDVSGTTPSMELLEPWSGRRDNNPENYTDMVYPGFTGDAQGDHNYFSDPNSYWLRSAMDHYERSDGDSKAFRLDGTYHLDDMGILTTVKAGVRYAKREQTVRRTGWNWGALAPEWADGTGWIADIDPNGDFYEAVDWSDFHDSAAIIEGNTTLHANENFIRSLLGANPSRNYRDLQSPAGSWTPFPARNNVDDKYGIFSPGEINMTDEVNKSVYVRIDFEGNDDLRYSGNVGLRYVKLDRTAVGSVTFPDLVPDFAVPSNLILPLNSTVVLAEMQRQVDDGLFTSVNEALRSTGMDENGASNGLPDNRWVGDRLNFLPNDARNFGNDSEQLVAADTTFSAWLPSFNLKVEVADDVIARFGLAKAIAYPDMGDVRNRNDVGTLSINENRITLPPEAGSDNPVGTPVIDSATVAGWTGSGGNPFLEPMESIQADVALEWYFAEVGQLSATLFRKNLDKFFIPGSVLQTIVNPSTGVSQTVDVATTSNGGKANMSGLELAYQQFFDMLPAPFDGLGLQATYTYIDASGAPNNQIAIEDEDFIGSDSNDTGIRVDLDVVPLEGQSRETANFVVMYEKEEWSARIAYNWRSRYLLTTRDVISKAPLWNEDRGQLDGSIFYKINDNITVGIQGTNLTNTQTRTTMLLNNDYLESGRSWFIADRRIALVARGNF